MTEFDQLAESLIFATGEGEAERVDEGSMRKLEEEYESFCNMLPEWFDIEDSCLVEGNCYEQFAHDYVMTRMGHGVGYWETSDWEEVAGRALTNRCKGQGMLEAYEEEGVIYVV